MKSREKGFGINMVNSLLVKIGACESSIHAWNIEQDMFVAELEKYLAEPKWSLDAINVIIGSIEKLLDEFENIIGCMYVVKTELYRILKDNPFLDVDLTLIKKQDLVREQRERLNLFQNIVSNTNVSRAYIDQWLEPYIEKKAIIVDKDPTLEELITYVTDDIRNHVLNNTECVYAAPEMMGDRERRMRRDDKIWHDDII